MLNIVFEALLRRRPIAVVDQFDGRVNIEGGRLIGIDLQGLVGRSSGLWPQFCGRRQSVVGFQTVGTRQSPISRRVRRILGNRLLHINAAFLQFFRCCFVLVVHAFQIILVGFAICRLLAGDLLLLLLG